MFTSLQMVRLHGLNPLCNYAANFPPNPQLYTHGEFSQPQTSISASLGVLLVSQCTKQQRSHFLCKKKEGVSFQLR